MRKRIIIGLLAVVVIGVVVFFLSQPKKGSVEWHKREYLASRESRKFEDWIGRGPPVIRNAYWDRKWKRGEFHHHQLINLGYLEERIFVISNRPTRDVMRAVFRGLPDVFPNDSRFLEIRLAYTNALSITAP